jgi:DNA-binding transcriptional MerR regulator
MAEAEKKFGIGEVQNLLKKEFPDVTISKIRFLEKEGLITPERTQSGYRKYTRTHVKQLSYVLRLQREEYLPLSVIKRKIQDLKSGKVIAGDLTLMSGQDAEPSLTGEVPISFDLAPAKVGLALETIEELIDYGVVKVREGPEGRYFSPADMRVLTIAKEFLKYGVEPRHLRIFTQFVTRESAFIEQIIRPQLQHKDPNAKRNALKELENLIGLSQLFIQTILREALAPYLPRSIAVDVPGEASALENAEGAEVEAERVAGEAQGVPARTDGAEMFPE